MNNCYNIFKFFVHPKFLLLIPDKLNIFHLNDAFYLKLLYEYKFNKKLDFNDLHGYNDKVQFLKIYDRKSIYTNMVDKYLAKEYVSNIIGEEYIIPTIGVYDKFDDIQFDDLPTSFVIKCTHDSGGVVIVKDKSSFDRNLAKKKINKCLKKNFYYAGREWPYKNVKPRIIIEKYLEEDNTKELKDYKFFCFNGKPKIMYISSGSHTNHQKIAFFDMDYNKLDIKRKDYGDYEVIPECPKEFEKMKKFASLLSAKIPHLRVDFYEVGGKIYFGELTFYTCSGFLPFVDEKWDKKMGDFFDFSNLK